MVSIVLLPSLSVPLRILLEWFRANQLQLESLLLLCSILLKVLCLGTYLSFRFILILLSGQSERQCLLFGIISFYFVCLLTFTLSTHLDEIKGFVCISKFIARLLLQDGFWVMHIPFFFIRSNLHFLINS